MSRTTNFHADLKRGNIGEELVASMWPELVRTDGRRGDFHLGTNRLEVKTESRALKDTENFFIERYSDFDKKSPGGPFQALEHGTLLYAHFFIKDLTIFLFFTQALAAYLKDRDESQLIFIQNPRYRTAGYKISRAELAHLFVVKTWEQK